MRHQSGLLLVGGFLAHGWPKLLQRVDIELLAQQSHFIGLDSTDDVDQDGLFPLIQRWCRGWVCAAGPRPGCLRLAKVSLRERAAFGADAGADADLVAFEPALLHFQDVLDVVGDSRNGSLIQRLHVVDFEDIAGRVDVGAGQGQERIAHPERNALRLGEDENHAFVLAHFLAEHHARLDLVRAGGLLGHDFFRAQPEFDRGQLGLGLSCWRRFRRGGGLGRRHRRPAATRLKEDGGEQQTSNRTKSH
jgi:hypothetical protein